MPTGPIHHKPNWCCMMDADNGAAATANSSILICFSSQMLEEILQSLCLFALLRRVLCRLLVSLCKHFGECLCHWRGWWCCGWRRCCGLEWRRGEHAEAVVNRDVEDGLGTILAAAKPVPQCWVCFGPRCGLVLDGHLVARSERRHWVVHWRHLLSCVMHRGHLFRRCNLRRWCCKNAVARMLQGGRSSVQPVLQGLQRWRWGRNYVAEAQSTRIRRSLGNAIEETKIAHGDHIAACTLRHRLQHCWWAHVKAELGKGVRSILVI